MKRRIKMSRIKEVSRIVKLIISRKVFMMYKKGAFCLISKLALFVSHKFMRHQMYAPAKVDKFTLEANNNGGACNLYPTYLFVCAVLHIG